MIEHLPSKHEAQNSSPNSPCKENIINLFLYNLNIIIIPMKINNMRNVTDRSLNVPGHSFEVC
jgi:hypothetical protein